MTCTVVVVSAHVPPHLDFNIGVLAFDGERLEFRVRSDLRSLEFDQMDLAVLERLPETLAQIASDRGAFGLIEYLEDTASNAIRLSDRLEIDAVDVRGALDLAFSRYVTQ